MVILTTEPTGSPSTGAEVRPYTLRLGRHRNRGRVTGARGAGVRQHELWLYRSEGPGCMVFRTGRSPHQALYSGGGS